MPEQFCGLPSIMPAQTHPGTQLAVGDSRPQKNDKPLQGVILSL